MSTSTIPPGTYYNINCYSDSSCSVPIADTHVQHSLVHFPGRGPPPVCYNIPETCTYVNVNEHMPRFPEKYSYLYYYSQKDCKTGNPIDEDVPFQRGSKGTGCVAVADGAVSLFVNQDQLQEAK